MIKILFVCHGNICRSPMAEFIFKDIVEKAGLSDKFEIASAATSTEEIWNGIGNPVYPAARKELARHGISCEGKRAIQLTPQDYSYYDYLIGMDSMNLRNMKRICSGDPDNKMFLLLDITDKPRDVADPWYTNDFKTTWNDVTEGCETLLDKLRTEMSAKLTRIPQQERF